jgi:tetratricopeptide (TPR) repeat protein
LRVQRYVQALVFKTGMAKIGLVFFGLLIGLVLAPTLSRAAAPQLLLHKADSLYAAGAEQQSLDVYEEIFRQNRAVSPRMLFRMAFLEENRGRIPQTLYYLSLLYTINPDEATRSKIESLARQYKLEGYEFDELDFFRQMLRRYSKHVFGAFTVVVGLLLVVLFRRRMRKKSLRLLPLAIVVLLGAATVVLNADIDYGKAVVLHANLPVMAEAASSAKAVEFAPAGTRLTVTGSDETWYRVEYKDHKGYVNRFWVGYF